MEGKAKAEFGDLVIGGSLQHSDEMPKPDFSGYVTKYGLKCSDGRTILSPAFEHQDKSQVPLVWQHLRDAPTNVLGHVVLEHRDDGVYGYAFLNDSENAAHAKTLVKHGDIKQFSIFANELRERSSNVEHGQIRETSLVLAGANPGALIDNIEIEHSDGSKVTLEDEAVIFAGGEIKHDDTAPPASNDGPTVKDVYDAMTDEQKQVVDYMVGAAAEEAKTSAAAAAPSDAAAAAAHSALPSKDDDINHSTGKDGRRMTRNVFEQNGGKSAEGDQALSHDALMGIVANAKRKGSFIEAVKDHMLEHGIEDIDVLFPQAKNIDQTPQFDKRRTEWVAGVLNATRKSPFSRVRTMVADITHEEARARGYIKGNFKKEEFFGLTKRVTTPTSFYKKQKLDRDDIIDITDMDVVNWLWGEMRLMLDEELARAILIGDGRAVDDDDKIRDPAGANEAAGIRSILHDHDLYAATINVDVSGLDTDAGRLAIVEGIMQDMRLYKGSGSPTFYTTIQTLNKLLLTKDGMNRRYWRTASDLATEMGVGAIQTVEVFDQEPDLIGIIVNLADYTIGTDNGGEVSRFDFFDIDYNQYKYLIEGRCSGGLTKIRSAIVVQGQAGASTEIAPTAPDFDPATGVITIPTDANVDYFRADTGAAVADGSTVTLANPGDELIITSTPTAGHYFDNNVEDQWYFERPNA